MPAAELVEWAAYEKVCGPLGPERLDHLVAQLCAAVTNAAGAKPARQPVQFLPKWDHEQNTLTDPAAMRASWRSRFG
jgi:hypothetical protein